ncbi:MAG: bifunctional 23S rRNA (guanine(2069)-N(7))-methyltransferase RlmK/23S rRNA (guanine(2445)-N(2))-methyltransferase RlmL, partial [Halioglobus sp.]|nr:bifunctional 23S rRNA (guanine(2069)-N(7))-methyltransferase RlmK/23S rRNA (guanine(2445)-N(2))-methyltransferase RlmL [Halioglobus sp.]
MNRADRSIDWFATCPKGVESLLLEELAHLGAVALRETVAGVYFSGSRAVMYRACLWSRLANRILWPLQQVAAGDEAEFYQGMRAIDWSTIFAVEKSFAINFFGQNRSIRHSKFGAQRAKDAIVDTYQSAAGKRPSVDRLRPDVCLHIRLVRDRAHVSVDVSGGSLHRRGYRQRAGAAPLKENLAAAILLRADWPGMAARGGALIDPMCGSGTLLLEGAMMAADIAPALAREHFGFEHLTAHDAPQWQAILADARGRAERGRAAQLPEMRGYDWDPASVRRAQDSIAVMQLEKAVRVTCKPLSKLRRPSHKPLPMGLLVCNPPYGERIGEKRRLQALYADLGAAMLSEFAGWHAAVLTTDLALGKATGLRSHKRYALYNGTLAAYLLLFDLGNNSLRQAPVTELATATSSLSNGAVMFANRIRKNRKRLSSWLQREQIECYRLYDADMPEYAVAIDIYGDHVHVAEYKAPAGVEPEAAQRRLADVRAALPIVLDVDPSKITFKQRSRQRGTSQYAKLDQREEMLTVREGPARLLVNLRDYLDTGLFLDYRPLRHRIGAEAKGVDFLNLFCYTGSASVHAALGGARASTSVALSNTYLDCLQNNLRLNELAATEHRVVRADCLSWLIAASCQYDLIP